MSFLTVAVCTYNRAENLPALVNALQSQQCSIPYEILVVNNNSSDNTQQVLKELKAQCDFPLLRFVKEIKQGIVHARNRAVKEAEGSDYLYFMDDDELPMPGLLDAAVDAFDQDGAECAGGKVKNSFKHYKRPRWLDDSLLGFLAEVDYGDRPFWISNRKTPLWTANIAFRTALFKNGLQFDARYNREGKKIGGGSDAILLRELLSRGVKIRYRPDMAVWHFPEKWRIKRSYFIKLHFIAGRKSGQYGQKASSFQGKTFLGIPTFMFTNLILLLTKTIPNFSLQRSDTVRKLMNVSHSAGFMWGRFKKFLFHYRT